MSQDEIYKLLESDPEMWFDVSYLSTKLKLCRGTTTQALFKLVKFKFIEYRRVRIWDENYIAYRHEYRVLKEE